MSILEHPIGPVVLDRLATEENVWLCGVRPDGSPHVTPVWFVFLQGCWWIGVDGGAVKVRVLAKNPRVSLALEEGRSPVVAEGDVQLHHDGFPAEVTAAFAAKYDWDVTLPDRPDGARVLLQVHVRRWLLNGVAQ
jgi:PPOX class probable F420-dependent enzyme